MLESVCDPVLVLIDPSPCLNMFRVSEAVLVPSWLMRKNVAVQRQGDQKKRVASLMWLVTRTMCQKGQAS